MIAILLASVASDPEIVITASRLPQEQGQSAASSAVLDEGRIERLGDPLAASLLRLTPSAAVEAGGPAGSLMQVRIRGAEANHTLLFIDGIRANDPAAGDIPRFELLNADIVSRVEIVRGPQSALWGSDAIGGVVAVNGLPVENSGLAAVGEAGSFGFGRASASGSLVSGIANLAGALAWQSASGIDSFGPEGDKDGFSNRSARLRGTLAVTRHLELGASGFAFSGESQFDGFDPLTFRRSDTLDSTRNALGAGRLWLSAGSSESGLGGTVSTSLLRSSNRNFLGREEINRTEGGRWTVAGQAHYRFATGAFRHSAVVALDHDRETFRARDSIYFGGSNQDRQRSHSAITGEWRTQVGGLVADLAVRRDMFSAFEDSTTWRASALVPLGSGLSATASYAKGIAQPSFFDLHGFFPGSFVGNPALKPESSRGFEGGLRYRKGPVEAALTAFRQKLRHEIVDIFDPVTFLSSTANRDGSSRRSGVEAELGWQAGKALRLTAHYAFLKSTEPGAMPGFQRREVRRPSHSGSVAADGVSGKLDYGASIAFVGQRSDTDFDVFPAATVRLKPYWLAGARVAYRLRPDIEIFARGSNLFDSRYQDVFGYRTEGRGLFAGVRLGGRRSSP